MVHNKSCKFKPKVSSSYEHNKKNQIITTGAIMSENECKRYFLGS